MSETPAMVEPKESVAEKDARFGKTKRSLEEIKEKITEIASRLSYLQYDAETHGICLQENGEPSGFGDDIKKLGAGSFDAELQSYEDCLDFALAMANVLHHNVAGDVNKFPREWSSNS